MLDIFNLVNASDMFTFVGINCPYDDTLLEMLMPRWICMAKLFHESERLC